ncbi:DUF1499 domain-containing protein [Sinorhizobium fredii]|uniref:DUF1499 domain-containing protein n=2 Tax=Rhizobium fredii TaxID=380 RepID=A0A2A6LXU2_RHIFR|nr:DUF1499 domain-containing protein [Sinorhizobium fredii]ASY68031.1 hypothetical protein SF83666_c05890 [Sinorhizobium fredii CCBAU 83666]AWI56294.1 hypothetical protein AB395_0000614 [Sinorhizobium fredii CCBAU 45436]AWM23959.1 hypothetical protein AOX55_0000680 [Sinorhizobium fredii CCBAU 25509]KSV81631.1 membrane protein [Sinorhizobium fredii USDA 205]MQW99576.1 DUF1499 domain-containing protein [Sinorhizobium fredii]
MMVRYERPYSHAAHWARRFARIGFVIFALSLAAHRFGPLTTPHFLALAGCAVAFALLAVLLATVGLTRLWKVAAVGGTASVSALFYAALPLGFFFYGAAQYLARPAIYDVSTDPVRPPPWIKAPVAEESWIKRRPIVTPEDREAQIAAYPGLTGRRYDGALDRVFQGVRKVVEERRIATTAELGVENARADLEDLAVGPGAGPDTNREPEAIPVPATRPAPDVEAGIPGRDASDIVLQGEWRTLIVGFRFDVLIRLREEAETTLVDLRVASRYGQHDLGMGAKFAEEFLRALDAELLGIAGD